MAQVGAFDLAAGRVLRIAAAGVCGLGLAAAVAQAVKPAPDQGVPTLRVYTNLLQVPTLVVDGFGKPVAPIAPGRFFISIDGGPKFRVAHVRPEADDPIALAILLDVSQPFPTMMARFDQALADLAPHSLTAKDRIWVFTQDCQLSDGIAATVTTTAALKHAVDESLADWTHERKQGGRGCAQPTNLFDSLAFISHSLSTQPGRRVILAVTDGVDRGSKITPEQVKQLNTVGGVAIFGLIHDSDAFFHPKPEAVFDSICEQSGGFVLTADGSHVAGELRRFVAMLRGRYIVEFPHPVDTVAGLHGLEMTIKGSDALVLPSGVGFPADDPAVLNDPTTIATDPGSLPQMGKRKIARPK